MVGKKSGKALLREEGLERTDNNMDLSSWPQIPAINQKNYYTDYLKRDDQILAYRLQHEEAHNRMTKKAKDHDRDLAMRKDLGEPEADADGDIAMEDTDADTEEAFGSKTIVLHLGSLNLRIGFASDALPKTMPMCIAHKGRENEAEANGGEPSPKRLKLDDGQPMEPEKAFGPDFANEYLDMASELRQHMRQNKRRTLPNSKEMVVNYNNRTPYETISEHNDPIRVEYTEIPTDTTKAPEHIIGNDALKIPDYSSPRYKLSWPMRHGWLNENDYNSRMILFQDLALIVEHAFKTQLNLTRKKEWGQYSCVFVIPDLYEKAFVTQMLDMLLREFGLARVCFFQESLAGTFGAGFSTACVVDIGAQKTSICCVDEGLCVENSRVNLKYGGSDVTELFVRMMLFDHFPYAEINLKRRYDFLLAEELKRRVCTLNEANVSLQVIDFHLRASGQNTRKYTFKVYDEGILAAMGIFRPSIFDNSEKFLGRRKLIEKSYDLYDGEPNDPVSTAESEILAEIKPPTPNGESKHNGEVKGLSTPMKPTNGLLHDLDNGAANTNDTPRSSPAGSPVPPETGSPQPPTADTPNVTTLPKQARRHLEQRDDILPIFPLDSAIFTSISNAARTEDRKFTDFLGGILVLGGGSLIPSFHAFLEEMMKLKRPEYASSIMVGAPPRDLDPQVVVWKGASVFGKLDATNDSWISGLEYDRLGTRILAYKCMWPW